MARVFTDEGISGSVPLQKRPAGRELLKAVQPGDTIIASKLDRMFRNARDAHTVAEQLKQRSIGLRLLDVMAGADITTGDGMVRAFFGMAVVFANLERDRIGERIREVKAAQKKAGEFLGGSRTFGYTKGRDGKLHPNPTEQKAIRYILRIRTKHSLRDIANTLVPQRFPGLKISHTTVSEVLKRR